MSKAPCLPLDGAKLIAHLRLRGLKRTLVATECGYADSYLSNCILKGRIGRDFAILLEHKYGITPEMYDPSQPFSILDTPKAPVIETKSLAEAIAEEVFKRLEAMQITMQIDRRR